MASYRAPERKTGRLKRSFGTLYYEVAGGGPAQILDVVPHLSKLLLLNRSAA